VSEITGFTAVLGACATAALAVLVIALGAPALAQSHFAPPGWGAVYDFLVQDACTDENGNILFGITPADGPARCPRHRDLRPREPIPYHKNDWPSASEAAWRPYGYHRDDTYPIETRHYGIAVIQARSFVGPSGEADSFRVGHGGGSIWLFSNRTVASGLTQDPSGLYLFYGPNCGSPDPAQRLLDAWVVVDKSYTPNHPGAMVARLTRYPERCGQEAFAYTSWRTVPVNFRLRSGGSERRIQFETLITDHFGGRSPAIAANMERFYLTRELGFTRWERWQNFDRQKRPNDARRALEVASSGRCDPAQPMPAGAGDWHLVACRQYTNLVPPANPGGDSPDLWIATIRSNPETARYFGN
jgi:hypothetical protein